MTSTEFGREQLGIAAEKYLEESNETTGAYALALRDWFQGDPRGRATWKTVMELLRAPGAGEREALVVFTTALRMGMHFVEGAVGISAMHVVLPREDDN